MVLKKWLFPALSALLVVAVTGSRPVSATDLFQDVAQSTGLTYTNTTYGASWADIDGDGRPDLWLGNHNRQPHLYRNDPDNGFELYTNINGLENEDIHGAAFADFDNDGDQDLLISVGAEVGAGTGPNQFLVNNNGQFVESAAAYGIQYEFSRARHVTWLDWNQDSFLDFVLIARNNRDTPPQAPSRIFTYNPTTNSFDEESFSIHNKDNTLFASLMFETPVASPLPTLIMSHNFAKFPDGILSYDANGFTNETNAYGIPTAVGFVRDFALADYDNDGDIDLFAAIQGGAVMLEQSGTGFTNVTAASNINVTGGLFTIAADFDNDKDVDIYIGRANPGADVNMTNVYLRNNNNGTFTQVAGAEGAQGTTSAFLSGISSADYNNDGFIDILATNSDNWYLPTTTGPIHLFENQGNGNNFLAISLVGTLDNRDAVGASVFLTSGGVTQLREQNGGVHHRSQNHSRLHFGLGSDTLVDTLEVHWPNGNVQTFNNIAPNQFLVIHQNDPATGNTAPVASFTASTTPNSLIAELDSSASMDPDGLITGYSWNFGDGNSSTDPNPSHTYATPGDYTVTLTVTDNNASSDITSQMLNLQTSTSVEAVGSVTANSANLLDENPDGSPDLTTHWTSDSNLANAWLTLDLGQTYNVAQVLIAPRGDRQYDMDIYVGDTLSGGKVQAPPVASCSTDGTAATVPTAYTICNIAATDGRYITVQSTNRTNFRVFGVDFAETVFANVLPLPAFSGTPDESGLQVAFDATNSSDADGTISNYLWSFGDGNMGAGVSPVHVYAATGTYLVGLTTTDNNGGTNTISAELTVAMSSAGILPSTVQAVGAAAVAQANLIDTLPNGDQDLNTVWQNNNGIQADAWFTLDLGATNTIGSVDIAPQANRLYRFNIFIGDNLNGDGKVTGVAAISCDVEASSSSAVPTALTPCPTPGANGRYVSVTLINRNKLPMYGVEVYGLTSANVAPQAAFNATQQNGNLTVNFDASASMDSDGVVISHLWTFGDGTAGAGLTTDHTYANDTERLISLSVTDDNGAIDATSSLLVLTPAGQVPQFVSQPQSLTVEEGESATFSALASGADPISYQWRVNGGDVPGAIGASYVIPSTTLSDDGAAITVVATNPAGSTTSSGAILTVTPGNLAPVASFTIDNTTGEAPHTVNVNAAASSDSDGNIASWDWNFGDGNAATGETASNTFLTDGTFTITLTVTDDDGATHSTTTTVTVNPPASPTIVSQPANSLVEEGADATFTVVATGGAPLAYQWRRDSIDIPGATAASYTLSQVTLADEGAIFSVFVSNSSGDITSANASLGVNAIPVAQFTAAPNSGLTPFTAVFDASASNDTDGSITDYSWDFGDGTTGTGVTSNHEYSQPGSFIVTLTVTDNEGASHSDTNTVVANAAPIAGFVLNTATGLAPLDVAADANNSSDPDGTITDYAWDFGDGSTATGITTSHQYTAGTYTLTLTVTDDAGATATSSQTVIANLPPMAAFSIDNTTGLAPVTINVDGTTSSDPDDSIASWDWDFGDGTSANGQTASHVYNTGGDYIVTLTVTDTYGATASSTAVVNINEPPVADLALNPTSGLVPLPITADATNSVDPNGTITSYLWDFGDGTTSSDASTAHTYTVAGTYTVTLTVMDNDGVSSTATAIVTANAAPVASFIATPASGFEPLPVSVDATGSSDANGTIESYSWDFGDGNTATGVSASNTYSDDGTYTISLTVTDNDGASTTTSQTVTADPVFPPSFDTPPAPQTVVLGDPATFTVVASGTPVLTYQWLRDGAPIPGATLASYTLPQTQINDHNATFSVQVTNFASSITSMPVALSVITGVTITTQPSPVTTLEGAPAVFIVNATGSPPITFQWRANGIDIPGAITSSYVIGSTLLADDGTEFSVQVSNGAGNAVSDSALLTVLTANNPPSAVFSATQIDNTLSTNLDASASTDSDGTIVAWDWDFGDTNTGSGETTSHTWTEDGTYTITLTVTDDGGKSTTSTQDLTIAAATAIHAVGAHAANQQPTAIIDTLGNDSQNLTTYWQSDSTTGARFFTLDLGTQRNLTELLIAPRANRLHSLSITAGDAVANGKVDGPVTASCTPPTFGFTTPVELQVCALPAITARFLTVQKANSGIMRIYGVEVAYQSGPVNNPPTAAFTATPAADSREVAFDASASVDSDGSITGWEWNYGDGMTGMGETVDHTYAANGTYEVVLTVTDNLGATATVTNNVTVDLSTPTIKVPASIVAVGGNPAQQDRITDELSNGSQDLTTIWDNNSNVLNTAWFTLNLASTRTLKELRIGLKGNLNYELDIVIGDALNNGQVSGGTTTLCATPGNGNNIPAGLFTCVVPELQGQFVTVRATNRSNYRVHGVEVWVEDTSANNAEPVASFNATQQINSLGTDFDGSASTDVDGFVSDWAWDFGDGNTGAGPTPTHSYAAAGDYTVALTVTDDLLATNTTSQTISILPINAAPLASFSLNPTAGAATLFVTANGSASSDSDGSIADWAWDFGDGNLASGETASNTYLAAGTYTVSLVVTDDDGASDTASATIEVSAQPEPPTITGQPQNATVVEGADATFAVVATGTPPLSYQWRRAGNDIPGANANQYTLGAVTLADNNATFDVIISNSTGTVTSAGATLSVQEPLNEAPTATFAANPQADGLSVNFDASGSSDSDGTLTSYSWDFGDGNSATGVATAHSYAADGTYSVVLTVTDDDGATATDTQNLTVTAPSGVAKVPASVAAVGGRLSVAGNILDELGDGTQKLATRWNSGGGGGLPAAWFTLDLGSSQNISLLKIAPRIDRTHTFSIFIGDTLSNGQVNAAEVTQCVTPDLGGLEQPLGLFDCPVPTTSGRYVTMMSLNVSNVRMYGAEVHAGGNGPANSPPVASVAGSPVVNSLQVDFDAGASSDTDGSIVNYEWDFGAGGPTVNTAIPTISTTYTAAGTYTVSVTVTDNLGATASATTTVTADAGGTGSEPQRLNVTVEAVGAMPSIDFRAIDELESGEQNLSSHWNNGSSPLADAWITLDLGSSKTLNELHLAPRDDRDYNLELTVSDTLSGGRATGGADATCSFSGPNSRVPTALTVCPLAASPQGRYVTIRSLNITRLMLFAAEAWGQ